MQLFHAPKPRGKQRQSTLVPSPSRHGHGLSPLLVTSGADQWCSLFFSASSSVPAPASDQLSCGPWRALLSAMDQEHLEFIMRHHAHQGGMGFVPADRGDSEEALGSSESEPAGRPRGKRARAAEVHNLSEKRRRSRINEKMKALQSLIPNSNKTDKASMLDEAIEYLKQLQLQVQMLSMRNGVYLNPSYLSGALEPVQASQMFAALGASGRNVAAPSSGAVAPPVNQSSGAHLSFDPMNSPQQNQPQPLVLASCPKTTIPEPPFHLESSQSHLQSFQLPESSQMMLRGDIMLKHHLTSAQERADPPGNKMNSLRQESTMLNTHFDGCSRSKEQSHDMVPANTRHV